LRTIFLHTAGLLALALSSCSVARHVPEGEYLLAKDRLRVKGEGLRRDKFEAIVRQRPNKKIF
jgi:hypothetical protein